MSRWPHRPSARSRDGGVCCDTRVLTERVHACQAPARSKLSCSGGDALAGTHRVAGLWYRRRRRSDPVQAPQIDAQRAGVVSPERRRRLVFPSFHAHHEGLLRVTRRCGWRCPLRRVPLQQRRSSQRVLPTTACCELHVPTRPPRSPACQGAPAVGTVRQVDERSLGRACSQARAGRTGGTLHPSQTPNVSPARASADTAHHAGFRHTQ
jgi:hypothetical protein